MLFKEQPELTPCWFCFYSQLKTSSFFFYCCWCILIPRYHSLVNALIVVVGNDLTVSSDNHIGVFYTLPRWSFVSWNRTSSSLFPTNWKKNHKYNVLIHFSRFHLVSLLWKAKKYTAFFLFYCFKDLQNTTAILFSLVFRVDFFFRWYQWFFGFEYAIGVNWVPKHKNHSPNVHVVCGRIFFPNFYC